MRIGKRISPHFPNPRRNWRRRRRPPRRGKREAPSETAEEEEAAKAPKQIFERLPPTKKDLGEEEIVLQFMMDFDIDEDRSRGLVETGYTDKSEFKDAIPNDLMMIKGINPTIAKRIIKKANE